MPHAVETSRVAKDIDDEPPIERKRVSLRGFSHDRSGTTVIEFAIVAVPFLMLVFAIFQIALYHFGLQSLDHATRLAAREIMLGAVAGASQTQNAFKTDIICPNFLMGFDCGQVVVNATKVAASASQGPGSSLGEFVDVSNLKLQAMSSGSFCIGGPGDYVFLDVSYAFPNFAGSILAGTGLTSSTTQLHSTTFLRNEPYKGTGAGC